MSALTATTAPCMTWGGGEGDQGDDPQGSIVKAIDGQLNWIQAADILGMTPRHLQRLKRAWERRGYDGLQDQRGRTPRRRRIPVKVIERLCRLRRESYADFSIQHFWEKATEE